MQTTNYRTSQRLPQSLIDQDKLENTFNKHIVRWGRFAYRRLNNAKGSLVITALLQAKAFLKGAF